MAGTAVDRDYTPTLEIAPQSRSAHSKDGDDETMKQHVLSGILCLAMAGCAQSRPALTKEDSKANPVAINPVPSLYETVNHGMGGKALAQTAMANPDDPHWAGRAQVAMVPKPTAARPAGTATGANDPSPPRAPSLAAPNSGEPQVAAAGQPTVDSAAAAGTASGAAMAGAYAASAGRPSEEQSPNDLTQSPQAEPVYTGTSARVANAGSALPQPTGATTGSSIAAASGLPPISDLPPIPDLPPTAAPSAPNAIEGVGPDRGALGGGPGTTAVSSTAESASTPASPPSIEASNAKPSSAKRDPLLGPDPDLMPRMDDVPAVGASPNAAAKESANPASADPKAVSIDLLPPLPDIQPASPDRQPAKPDPQPAKPGTQSAKPDTKSAKSGTKSADPDTQSATVEPKPATAAPKPANPATPPVASPAAAPSVLSLEVAPPLQPAPSAGTKPADPEAPAPPELPELPPTPSQPDKSTATSKPAPAGLLAAEVPLETAPVSSGAPFASANRISAGPAPAAPPRDARVVLTSGTVTDRGAARDKNPNLKAAGYPVARVGDEIITSHDLIVAVKEAMIRYPELRQRSHFDTQEQMAKRQQIDMLARSTLAELIQRSMLAQEAKRQIQKHDSKQLDHFNEMADRWWRDEELPPMKRSFNVETEQQLREKLAEQGRSLDSMRQTFRQEFLAQGFLHDKLKDKMAVELPDLLKFYSEHVPLHDFDRPALVTWREIVVDAAKYRSRAEARQKAEQFLHGLQSGEDFAKLARAQSDGPSSSRAQGGLMQTTPGGYAVPTVNSAIDTLKIGQLSGVLEGPESFHIVKVENRRPAGPASFEEVQDKIKPILERQKQQEQRTAYLAKLRKKTMIWTVYDGTAGDPKSLLP